MAEAPEAEDTQPVFSEFLVTVRDVVQLVDTLSVAVGDTGKDQHGARVREGTVYLTDAQVAEWIVDVASRVKTRLASFHRIRPASRLWLRLAQAGHDVVANGAASYVYAAAAPEKAEMVDTTSYAEVLWRRYLTGLDDLEEAFARWCREFPDDLEPEPVNRDRVPGSGRFPRPVFRDDMRW